MSSYYIIFFHHFCEAAISIKISLYLFVSVALICHVLYLKKIILSKHCILYGVVLLNSVLLYICKMFLNNINCLPYKNGILTVLKFIICEKNFNSFSYDLL